MTWLRQLIALLLLSEVAGRNDGSGTFTSVSLTSELDLRWTSNSTAITAELSTTRQNSWVAFGLSETGNMIKSDVVIGVPSDNSVLIYPLETAQAYIQIPTPLEDEFQILTNTELVTDDSGTKMTFTWPIQNSTDVNRVQFLADGQNLFIWSYGMSGNLGAHSPVDMGRVAIVLSTDGAKSNELMGINLPFKVQLKAHGILAFIAWGVLTPIAILSSMARNLFMCNVGSNGKKAWLIIHIVFNFLSYTITLAAFALSINAIKGLGRKAFDSSHGKMGIAMLVFLFVQVMGGILRPDITKKEHKPEPTYSDSDSDHDSSSKPNECKDEEDDHDDETPQKSIIRIVWEFSHRLLALVLVICSIWQMHAGIERYERRFGTGSSYKTAYWIYVSILFPFLLGIAIFAKLKKNKAERESI
mmetsp:Transcript_11396/g.16092  ORF Transcript_11396/g.16092 Transcript_11396/m.16092 type:complete len:415 (-) Transcript_11396:137-1381(-)